MHHCENSGTIQLRSGITSKAKQSSY